MSHVQETCDFMSKHIDGRQLEKIAAFRHAAIYAALTGEVSLVVKGSKKVVTKFSSLRATFKKEIYRYSKLVPTPSDVDYAEMLMMDLTPVGGKKEALRVCRPRASSA